MKRITTLALLALCMTVANAQLDTTYFDKDWKECTSVSYNYFRTIKETNKAYIVTDHYKNGQIQMIFHCSALKPDEIQDGPYIVFDSTGFKTIKGEYASNKPTGTWTWYEPNESDSTVATYNANGTKNYTRMSRALLEKQKHDDVYTLADVMPQYKGGLTAQNKFIAKNFRLSAEDKKNKVKGTIYVSMVVTETGQLENAKVVKSLSSSSDKGAIDMVAKMPNWIPGKMDGKPVKVRATIGVEVK